MQGIYLMPFSAKSILFYHAWRDRIRIAGFFDEDEGISGMRYDGCVISTPRPAPEDQRNTMVIICDAGNFEKYQARISNLGYANIFRYGQALSCEKVKAHLPHIDEAAFLRIVPGKAEELLDIHFCIYDEIYYSDALRRDDALAIYTLDIVVTERCTLRCKYCANLIQYFKNPQDMDLDQVYRDIDLIFAKADWISKLHLFGGESFLYKRLAQALDYTAKYKSKFGKLYAITNGTILPNEETLDAMKRNQLHVVISDYNALSKNLNNLAEKLSAYDIRYITTNPVWFAGQQLVDGRGRDAKEVFNRCTMKCTMLQNGLLYRCPFLAHSARLNAVPYSKHNYIDISKEETQKIDIKNYLSMPDNPNTVTPPGCAYCSGYEHNMPIVPVAEQAGFPLPYKVYDAF